MDEQPLVGGRLAVQNPQQRSGVDASVPRPNGAVLLSGDISVDAEQDVKAPQRGPTLTRPQSAYVRGASQTYNIGVSRKLASTISTHQFFGDQSVPLMPGTPNFRSMVNRPNSATPASPRVAIPRSQQDI
jgi:hypothetical protein